MPFTYDYPRPAVTVDCVVIRLEGRELKVLLVQRNSAQFRDHWALPGGFIEMNEDLETAARRELHEETGLTRAAIYQFGAFGDVKRDSRGRVVTVAHFALLRPDQAIVRAGDDAADAQWFSLNARVKLAFDHKLILGTARERLREWMRFRPVAFDMLPREFTLSQLQALYEAAFQRELDKRNFRRKVLNMELLQEVPATGNAKRRTILYRFDSGRFRQMEKSGTLLELI